MPRASAAAMTLAALPGTRTVRVSKKDSLASSRPAIFSVAARARVLLWTVSAIAFSPSGPW